MTGAIWLSALEMMVPPPGLEHLAWCAIFGVDLCGLGPPADEQGHEIRRTRTAWCISVWGTLSTKSCDENGCVPGTRSLKMYSRSTSASSFSTMIRSTSGSLCALQSYSTRSIPYSRMMRSRPYLTNTPNRHASFARQRTSLWPYITGSNIIPGSCSMRVHSGSSAFQVSTNCISTGPMSNSTPKTSIYFKHLVLHGDVRSRMISVFDMRFSVAKYCSSSRGSSLVRTLLNVTIVICNITYPPFIRLYQHKIPWTRSFSSPCSAS